MPYSRLILLIIVFSLTAACGEHRSISSGRLNGGESFTGNREKLVTAIDEGDAETVTLFLNGGLDPNTLLDNGRPLLVHAVIQNQLKVARLLLTHGAQTTRKDSSNKTALDYAQESGNIRAWVLLDPDKQNEERSILIEAIKKKRLLRVGTQLDNGTDPNYIDGNEQGETPLTLALDLKASAVAEKIATWKDPLEITSTDVNLANQSGVRPLSKAKAQGLLDMIPLLESLGAKE